MKHRAHTTSTAQLDWEDEVRANSGQRPRSSDPEGQSTEHVILVAVTVNSATRESALRGLEFYLPRPGAVIEDWWIAEDERYDGSDNESAVFVPEGMDQTHARMLLDDAKAALS